MNAFFSPRVLLDYEIYRVPVAQAMSDSIMVQWGPPKDQSIKVRGYVISWGKGDPEAFKKVLDGKQRSYVIENLGKFLSHCLTLHRPKRILDG